MRREDDEPEEVAWEGRFIAAKRRGKWEYVSRTRDVSAAVILAVHDGQVILVEQYRVLTQILRCPRTCAHELGHASERFGILLEQREVRLAPAHAFEEIEHALESGIGVPMRRRSL